MTVYTKPLFSTSPRDWICTTQGMTIDTKSQRGKTVSEQVTTCNLRLLHCLADSSGQEGGMHVWNVTPGDTDGDSLLLSATGCALPLNYNRWRWRASVHVCEGGWRIWMWEYSCLLHAHLSTRTTWHLPMQWRMWDSSVHRCNVGLNTAVIQNQCARHNPMWCVCMFAWDWGLAPGSHL